MEKDHQPQLISKLRYYLIAIIHLGVGISIVAISSFVNAELSFANWSTDQITIFLGIPIMFELTRLFFSHLYDTRNVLIPSLIFGLSTSAFGVFLIPYFITPVGNIMISVVVSAFYLGSSILTTLVDSNLTLASSEKERGKIAGIIQIMRLTGFAIGGIVGSFLYPILEFDIFISIIVIFYIFLGIITLSSVIRLERTKEENREFIESMKSLLELISSGMPLLMTIFLFIYPMGLFMQDLILEPFAIVNFNFERENVGRVVAIWTTLTLIFVPIGVKMANIMDRMIPIIGGAIIAMIGLLFFSASAFFDNLLVFYAGLVLFGIGNGISSAPAIGMMLDVSAAHPKHLAILLGFFGIMTTVGRSLAAVMGGIILYLTDNNYTALFIIEALILLIGYYPLIPLERKLKSLSIEGELLDPIKVSSIDLN